MEKREGNNKKSVTGVKWEVFMDDSFYHMWAVRPIGDTDYNSPRLFHFVFLEDANKLKDLLEKAHCAIPS